MWNTKIYVATKAEGLDVTNLVIVMEVNPMLIKNENNFVKAVKSASTEYCLTDEGKRVFEGNCNSFNWGDFDTYVPNSICEKYGIRKKLSFVSAEFCFDQELVDEEDVFPEIEQVRAVNIEWDIDDEEGDKPQLPPIAILPDEYIKVELEEDGCEDVSAWLSEEYGYCHKGFQVKFLSVNDLKEEESKLKKAIFDAGVNAIEEFLGHPLDSEEIDIDSEMDDVLTQIPDEEYVEYLVKYGVN